MIRRPPRSTQSRSSAASDVYKRQVIGSCYRARHNRSPPHTHTPIFVPTPLLLRPDSTGRKVGSVAVGVCVRESCSASLWSLSADDRTFELLWARVDEAFIGAIYHPPESLLNYLELCAAEVTRRYPTATIIVAGDFNQLPEDAVVERTGLTQIVH